MTSSSVPQLTVTFKGYGWKARFHIHVMMIDRPIADIRDFVKLYLRHMPFIESNVVAIRQIITWFDVAIAVATGEWKQASRDYVTGYTGGNWISKAQAAENKRLLKAVEKAKKSMIRLEKRKTVFIEECIARKIPID